MHVSTKLPNLTISKVCFPCDVFRCGLAWLRFFPACCICPALLYPWHTLIIKVYIYIHLGVVPLVLFLIKVWILRDFTLTISGRILPNITAIVQCFATASVQCPSAVNWLLIASSGMGGPLCLYLAVLFMFWAGKLALNHRRTVTISRLQSWRLLVRSWVIDKYLCASLFKLLHIYI